MASELFSIEIYDAQQGKWSVSVQVYGRREANFTYEQVKTLNPHSKIRMVAL